MVHRFWIRPGDRPLPARARRRAAGPRFRPGVEALEDRLLLTTYTVTNSNDSGAGSLRQAILDSNGSPGSNTIGFSIGRGVQFIHPAAPLPAITVPVLIDGSTQPGFTGTPLIVLDGTSAGTGTSARGLYITAGSSTVRDLVIDHFSHTGITLMNGGGNVISGNYIGTDFTGTVTQGNGDYGIAISNSNSNMIGGAGGANLLSGNRIGIGINGQNNQVQGNLIGTDVSGTRALGNGTDMYAAGVYVGGMRNLIGGAAPGDRNLISGNQGTGVSVAYQSTANQVVGNFIGTNPSGSAALGNVTGIEDAGQNTTIGGTAAGVGNLISGNGTGIRLDESGCQVQGNLIGTNADGTAALANGICVSIIQGTNNTVGGTAVGARNVISGNTGAGVAISFLFQGGTSNLVEGNLIGTDAAGAAALPNQYGVEIYAQADRNTIGGTALGAGNLISGNTVDGISLASNLDQVQGNTLGTNAGHTALLPNHRDGISIIGTNNTIGGAAEAARNVIAGNSAGGIDLDTGASNNVLQGNVIARNGGNGVTITASATGNVLLGNAIGTVPDGSVAQPNALAGISIAGRFNTVGGTSGGAGNVISGNTLDGVRITGSTAMANLVEGNFIGTNAAGNAALGNGGSGILIEAGSISNLIGGTAIGAGNIIAANRRQGLDLTGTMFNLVRGNFIGTDRSGAIDLGNGFSGVSLGNASENDVGGTVAGTGNTIAFNGDDGVLVDTGTGNLIEQNAIHASGYLGIELVNGGNHNQAFPALTSVTSDSSSTTITGTLNSTPDTTLTLEFFANDVCNPSGYGEGQIFLGAAAVTTDDTGAVTFTVTLGVGVAAGQFVSATATDPAGNTSAFAACVAVSPPTDAGQTPLALRAVAVPYLAENPPTPASADPAWRVQSATDLLFARWGQGAIPAPGSGSAEPMRWLRRGETGEKAAGLRLVAPAGETDDLDLWGWPA